MQGLHCVATWFGSNADAINAAAAIAGVLVAIFGFGFTVIQIRETRQALQASNTYAIQKDARDLVDAVLGDEWFRKYLKTGKIEKNGKQSSEARQRLWTIFHFYLSVYRQHEADGITSSFSKSIGSDFEKFMGSEVAKDYYREKRGDGAFHEEHAEMVNLWCPSQACKLNSPSLAAVGTDGESRG